MRTQLLTLLMASLAVVSVGQPWMKPLAVGVAIGAVFSLAVVLLEEVAA